MGMPSESSSEGGSQTQPGLVRKIRIRKIRPNQDDSSVLSASEKHDRDLQFDRKLAELIPGLADLSVSNGAMADAAMGTATAIRKQTLARQEARRAEAIELANIYDMSKTHPLDSVPPPSGSDGNAWSQSLRPPVRKVVLSPYQYEMINYQRMLMRKNVWYYRDRMSVPRGPCPLHTLKDAWVQGVIDENTLVWGQGLYDWLPAKNVTLLLPMIRTPEVRLGAWMKRTFSLKPALNKIRESRKDFRDGSNQSKQVEVMR